MTQMFMIKYDFLFIQLLSVHVLINGTQMALIFMIRNDYYPNTSVHDRVSIT